MKDVRNIRVLAHNCLPHRRVQLIYKSGVKRLNHLFNSNRGCAKSETEEGFNASSNSSLVTQLRGSLRSHLRNGFKEIEGLTKVQASAKKAIKQNLHGFVDRRHSYGAISELASYPEGLKARL